MSFEHPLTPTVGTESMESWRDEFVIASDLRGLGRATELRELESRGELRRVVRGIYRRTSSVNPHDPDDAYLTKIRATSLASEVPLTFAGLSAAVVWGLPLIGNAPREILVASLPESGGRSNSHVRRTFAGSVAPAATVGGIRVTTVARTAVDVARRENYPQALAVADAALSGQESSASRAARDPVSREDLYRELERFQRGRGTARARSVIADADGSSGSAGESVSRANIRLLGFPSPELQHRFVDGEGLVGIVDFWWPDFNLIGEFDGQGKYLRDEFTNGADPATVIMREKARENRLRALGPSVTRWDWPVAMSLPRLRARLLAAGLRTVHDR
jgi:hypothetical protein